MNMNPWIRNLIATSTLVSGALALTGCGARVEVPTAHIGKVKTAEGLEEGLKYPSSFRLPIGLGVRNELILVETSHFPVEETLVLFMPKDELNMTFEVRGTMFIEPDRSEDLFERMNAQRVSENRRILRITARDVYTTYGQQLIRSRVRSLLSQYSIQEVLSQREVIENQMAEEITSLFQGKSYPLGVIQFGFGDIQPPEVIVKAQELAKEREVSIQTAEAQKMVALKEAEAALEMARKQQEIDLLEAETQVLVEQKLSESVNEAFVTQRALKVLEHMAVNPGKTFVLPMEAFQRPELLLGIYDNAIGSQSTQGR